MAPTATQTLSARLSVVEMLLQDIIAQSLASDAELTAWTDSIAPGASAAADSRGLAPEGIAYQLAWDNMLTGVQRQFRKMRG